MKFREIVRYEFVYQLTRIWTLIIFFLLLVVSFLFTRDGSLSEVLYAEFFLNSPFVIAGVTVLGGLVWLLTAALIAGDAAARDISSGMSPISYSMPVEKWQYLGGRIAAVLLIQLILLTALPMGNLLSVYAPGVSPELVGPFRPAAYLTAFSYLAIPNLIAATSLQFFLALRGGKPMAAFLGSLLMFFISFGFCSFLMVQGKRELANALDPIGMHFIMSELSRLWTTAEKSYRLLELNPTVLHNRLIWTGVASVFFMLTYFTFHQRHRVQQSLWQKLRSLAGMRKRRRKVEQEMVVNPTSYISVPRAMRSFGLGFHIRQCITLSGQYFKTATRSWAGLILLILMPLMTLVLVIDQMEFNSVPLIPTTTRVLLELTSPPGSDRLVIVPLLLILITGELVWKERDAGVDDFTDTMPGSSWVPLLSKFFGLALLVVLFITFQTAAGMAGQLLMEYDSLETGLYLYVMYGLQLPDYLLYIPLALMIHVLVNNKYLAHLVTLLVLMVTVLPWLFGLEHNLLLFGHGPGWSYTEMRGFGSTLGPWFWFRMYWMSWAFLFLAVARMFWVRGRETRLKDRWSRPSSGTGITFVSACLMVLFTGGYVFYNTNILNDYRSADDTDQAKAAYERLYGRYENDPQPTLREATLNVEVYPDKGEAVITGSYLLVNQHEVPVDTIHLATDPTVETRDIELNQVFRTVVADSELGHHSYSLTKPLQPGDSLTVAFTVRVNPRGFRENGVSQAIVSNGSHFTNAWLPAIGYQPMRQILTPGKRREAGLPERPVISSLYNAEVWENRDAGLDFKTGVTLNTTISTAEGQTAVAPGRLTESWQEGDRTYFRYRTDGPVGNQWDFFSARYGILKNQWTDPAGESVDVRIYYHPGHDAAPERMAKAVFDAFDYYSEEFGPYEYDHLTLIERPGNGIGMHAEASLINYSEGSSLFRLTDDPDRLDLPYAVICHEIAHQWTVPYAFVEGAPVMTESIAWYYGLKAIEHARGKEQMRRMLAFMRRPYPYAPIRRGEPLLRGLDPYMAYRKGPFALYTLSEYAGEDRVNNALHDLLRFHNTPGAPLATTLDLYREIDQELPDSLHFLLHDLFEVNVFWNLEVENTRAVKVDEETWNVSLDILARKIKYDSTGAETELTMEEWIDVGVFGAALRVRGELSNPLYVKRHRITSGRQTISITVKGKPVLAGVDPYHVLDWEEKEDDDNIAPVRTVNQP